MAKLKRIKAHKRWILLAAAVILITVGIIALLLIPRRTNELSGEVYYQSCIAAGVGCFEYTISLDNGDSYGLGGEDGILLENLVDKRVKLHGEFKESEHLPGKYFYVTSVEVVQ